MRYGTGDWLEVVYCTGLEVVSGWGPRVPTEVGARAAPPLETLTPGVEHRIRVTVSPSIPGRGWRLQLRDTARERGERGTAEGGEARVRWRVYPGTWQPLLGERQCVAEGRGRVRVNISIYVEALVDGELRLRFEPEAV